MLPPALALPDNGLPARKIADRMTNPHPWSSINAFSPGV